LRVFYPGTDSHPGAPGIRGASRSVRAGPGSRRAGVLARPVEPKVCLSSLAE
jgi:hypothetical protein